MPFEERFTGLKETLAEQFAEAEELSALIQTKLGGGQRQWLSGQSLRCVMPEMRFDRLRSLQGTPTSQEAGYPDLYVKIPQMKGWTDRNHDFGSARKISHEDFVEWLTKKATCSSQRARRNTFPGG